MTTSKSELPYALHKWAELKLGKRVIMSDYGLDALSEYFMPQDTDDAKLFFGSVASIPNPNPVGVRDQYIVFIK